MSISDRPDAPHYEHKNPDSDVEPTTTTAETPLLAEVSAEDAPAVEDFMVQAAAQNEAAAIRARRYVFWAAAAWASRFRCRC